ncbi:hypothetical protein RHGRI_002248 [Rhododendron griersonianum]|uniref:EF-hand domain-containing protein n=1 Tax=Rhododendron griersonianum TaxID=479676 RepID=A0AAV6LS31_9ERIC|nr:hypothetical protein RHGRI_002248 [Rhododendron griersonianum]
MFQLVQKLKKCKGALRPWSKMEFGNNVEKIKALKEHLALMQLHPFSQEQFDKEKQLKEELEITMLREEMYLHQRSRINWLNFGDKNSAFFHATVIQRRQRNQMSKIRDEEGHWFTEEAEINSQLKLLLPPMLIDVWPGHKFGSHKFWYIFGMISSPSWFFSLLAMDFFKKTSGFVFTFLILALVLLWSAGNFVVSMLYFSLRRNPNTDRFFRDYQRAGKTFGYALLYFGNVGLYYFSEKSVASILTFLFLALYCLCTLFCLQPYTDFGTIEFLLSASLNQTLSHFGLRSSYSWLVIIACIVIAGIRYHLEPAHPPGSGATSDEDQLDSGQLLPITSKKEDPPPSRKRKLGTSKRTTGVSRSEKVKRIHQQFDSNRDGGLNHDEMAALVVAVNPRVKFSDEQINAILDEVFKTYGEFIDGEKGLTYDGLLRTYDDGAGDVDRDFDALGLELKTDSGGDDVDTWKVVDDLTTRGSRSEKVERIFQQFDSNRDGGLNREEMAALVVAVNPRVKFSDGQINVILDEVCKIYGEKGSRFLCLGLELKHV